MITSRSERRAELDRARRSKQGFIPLIRKIFTSPYGVMGVVLLMYVSKVASKLTIGDMVNSPMITGDGWHNVADIFEACVVIGTIWFSRLPESSTYPLGRKNIESLFSVAVGGLLAFMAVKISWQAGIGSGQYLDTGHAPLIMGPHLAPWVMGVTGGSALLSLIVSRYQIRIGKKTGHEALVADGEETASDGRIEMATFAGVCGQYLFQAPWIEYPVAFLVACLMIRTGWEIFSRGMGALLQRTIGREHDITIQRIVENMYGINGVAQLKTFRTGDKVVLIMKVISRVQPRVQRIMKEAIASLIADYLRGQAFEDGEFFIRFDPPKSDFRRRAVLLDEHHRVVRSLQDAVTVVICDVEYDIVTRATEHTVSGAGGSNRGEVLLWRSSSRSVSPKSSSTTQTT